MDMLDILRSRLPAGLAITSVKEKPSKYIVRFSYEGEDLRGSGELVKACTPGSENAVCDTTIQVVMTGFMLDKKDMAGAEEWMSYAKRAATAKTVGLAKPVMRVYVIEVINDGFGKLSQEGYDSLEKAQAFIEKRGDGPKQISPCHYRAESRRGATDYLIHDILVR